MPKTKISEYSTTNSDNTDIESINIAEGCAPSGINNAIRELMVHLKEFQTGASGDAFTFAGGVLISGTANTITGNVLMSGTNTITGSTTATFAAGAVGTPSIAAHGDTNTGIFFPAADTIAFAEGGAEAMRIDSSGNVGIGTTSATHRLTVVGDGSTARFVSASSGGPTIQLNATGTSGRLYGIGSMDSAASLAPAGSFYIRDSTDGVTRFVIDSSGNVAIGNTSASYKLDVTGPDNIGGAALGIYSANRTANLIISYGSITASSNSGELGLKVLGANPINFSTNSSERARITSDGNLLVGQTGGVGANGGKMEIYVADNYNGGPNLALNVGANNTGGIYLYFTNASGTKIGSVTQASSTSVAYNTTSDYRLKENIQPMTGALAKVQALNPVTFNWKDDGSSSEGFIAHELQEIIPKAVVGSKDAMDADGKPNYQGVDTSFLVATLTAAIQELKAELDTVKAELNTLKGA